MGRPPAETTPSGVGGNKRKRRSLLRSATCPTLNWINSKSSSSSWTSTSSHRFLILSVLCLVICSCLPSQVSRIHRILLPDMYSCNRSARYDLLFNRFYCASDVTLVYSCVRVGRLVHWGGGGQRSSFLQFISMDCDGIPIVFGWLLWNVCSWVDSDDKTQQGLDGIYW